MSGYKGKVLSNYKAAHIPIGAYFTRNQMKGRLVEFTLLTGRVIVREIANLRRDLVVLKSHDELFARIYVPLDMIMTISEPVNRVDTDFNREAERIELECQPTEHRDFSSVVGSTRAGGKMLLVELSTGHKLIGKVVNYDREQLQLQMEGLRYPTYVSYRGIASVSTLG